MVAYLDCNATTPMEPQVANVVMRFMTEEFGNAGSRTHQYGARAKRAAQRAREQVASVVDASPDEVVFTSGATESNNLAILGLAQHADETGRRHILTTQIEHKAVLEPIEHLAERGFDVTTLPVTPGGWVEPEAVKEHLRADTLLVSVMHVNNETGVVQPLTSIARLLDDHPAFFHVDAAQGFGKDLEPLKDRRIDLVSVSGHKIYGPKGIGALVARRRRYDRPPLRPLMWGGGQERGLRAGTLPVPLIVGLGLAAEMAEKDADNRSRRTGAIRAEALTALHPLDPHMNGDPSRTLPHVLNLSFPCVDSEAVIVALKGLTAVSNGSACTSASYEPSHVLKAMGLSGDRVAGAVRLSWCHMTADVDWPAIAGIIATLR